MSRKALAACVVVIVLMLGSFLWTELLSPHGMTLPNQTETSGDSPHPLPASTAEIYKKPPAGGKGNLTASELAWALRERLTLDIMADLVEGRNGIALYNERTTQYNELAGNFHYLEQDMRVAQKRVEEDREKIASVAADEALAADVPDVIRTDRAAVRIWTAQKLLRERGLYLSRPNGQADRDTIYAVKTYQMQRGEPQTGEIDDKLVAQLKADYLYGKRGMKIGF